MNPRYFTLTGNLLAETTAEYTPGDWGQTLRARRETFQVGGKGVNVARLLVRLGADATAICFLGGAVGERCRAWLAEHAIPTIGIPVARPTRSGWVARVEGRPETTFLGADQLLDIADWQQAITALLTAVGDQPFVLGISGSIPGWGPAFGAALAPLFDLPQRDRCLLAIDTYGPPLRDLVQLPFDLVKINRREFAGLCADPCLTTDACRTALRKVADQRSIGRWVITDGPNPVLAIERVVGALLEFEPERVAEVSPVGAGDAMLAVLLNRLSVGVPLADAVPLAMARAARVAASGETVA
jgi:1-phosphofructokinase